MDSSVDGSRSECSRELSAESESAYKVMLSTGPVFLDRALTGGFVWSIGCGISQAVLPSTGELMLTALETLRELYRTARDEQFARGFKAVVDLVGVAITIDGDPSSWRQVPCILERLAEKYPEALERLETEIEDKDIVFDILRVPAVFGDANLEPATEHRMLAILMAEGIVDDVITTNWDCLLERAFVRLARAGDLAVAAHPDELAGHRPRLLKIHGCAGESLRSPEKYGPFLVVTAKQIDQWTESGKFKAFREAVHTSLRERPVAVIGLSTRDHNLRSIASAVGDRGEPYATDVPRAVFAEQELNDAQSAFLSRLHGVRGADAERLRKEAVLHLYASELFAGLWLHTIRAKLRLLLDMGHPVLEPEWLDAYDGLVARLLARVNEPRPDDSYASWSVRIAAELPPMAARLVGMYRRQDAPSDLDEYEPYYRGNLAKLRGDDAALQNGVHLPIALLVMLLSCAEEHGWDVTIPVSASADSGQLTLRVGGFSVRIFVLLDSVHDFERIPSDETGDCLVMFGRGVGPQEVRRDVLRSRLPNRRRVEDVTYLSLDGEILSVGKGLAAAKALLADRVPLGVT